MLIENNQKDFQNPETGTFLATLIDVVDLGKVHTQFGDKVKIRLIWVLNASDSEGQPFRVMRQVTASINEKSALYEIVKGVLGTAPPVPFDSETLIGRSNQLVIVKEKDAKTGKEFANVKVILPLPTNMTPPQAPAGFVRSKDRPARNFPTNGAPAVAQAPAPAAANTVANTATAGGTAAPQPATAPSIDAAF